MFVWFQEDFVADLFVAGDEHGCVLRAARDVARDVCRVCGQTPNVKPYLPVCETQYVVAGSLESPSFSAWASGIIDLTELEGQWEAYAIHILEDRIVVAGSDRRGAMYGLYTLSRLYLDIDPTHWFTGRSPSRLDSLTIGPEVRGSAPSTFRFRGFFINDEDLLTKFRLDGGSRFIDYPYYSHVVHESFIDRVLETALRLGMNLIIPASFVDIMNPAEENLVRLTTERGLFISQHHAEPMGMSHFGFENFWKRRGRDLRASYVSYRAEFEETWRAYAERWARYEGVIWQLGLRGRGDRPVWHGDANAPRTDAERGALISGAIATQYEIVKEVLGHEDFLSSSTLWMEGSLLYHGGHLRFPERTMLIFADVGHTQMMGRDFFDVPREPGRQFGIYYHVAFWGAGPHLAQGTELEKMAWNLGLAVEKGDTAYVICNVSNIREVVLSVCAYAQMARSFADFQADRFLSEFAAYHFGKDAEQAAVQAYRAHYAAFAEIPDTKIGGGYDTLFGNADIRDVHGFRPCVVLDGVARQKGLSLLAALETGERGEWDEAALSTWRKRMEAGLHAFEGAYVLARSALPAVPPGRRAFFADNLVVQIEIMLGLYGWVLALVQALQSDMPKPHAEHALYCMEKLLGDREKAAWGPWAQWYRGDDKMNLPGARDQTRALVAQLQKA